MVGKILIFSGCVVWFLAHLNCVFCDNVKIYDYLVECYRGNRTDQFASNSLQNLLEIIRKVEDAYPTSIDIRTLSANILHRLRVDGIERAADIKESTFITPYRAKGLMLPKFEILLKLISDVPTVIKFEDVLTQAEICLLHRLISSSVESHVRGDEKRTCFQGSERPTDWIPRQKVNVFENGKTFVVSDQVSQCPIELGVIRTNAYGTLSPGIVIASIAAGLQPQMVQIKEIFPLVASSSDEYENLETMDKRDTKREIKKLLQSLNTIDNTIVANIAGDLAEVCVYQAAYYGANVSIGVQGRWDSEEYPLFHYIRDNVKLNWLITDSEILGGLDGFHLASNILSWVNRIHRLKLSQVLEMYYSPRGVPIFAIESANQNKKPDIHGNSHSKRFIDDKRMSKYQQTSMLDANMWSRSGFEDNFDNIRYIDSACERKYILRRLPRSKLKEQTHFFAQVLQYSTNSIPVEPGMMKFVCNSAVDRFFEYSTKLTSVLPECDQIRRNHKRPSVDLTIIIDGSRSKFENFKLVSYLAEMADVSSFGSRLSVIHGGNGQYMVKPTRSIIKAFEDLKEFSGPFPTSLSLSDSLAAVVLGSQLHEDPIQNLFVKLPRVLLVVSQGNKLTQTDFENSKSLFEGSLLQFKEMHFVFLTSDAQTFQDLVAGAAKIGPAPQNKYHFMCSNEKEPKAFAKTITAALLDIPKSIQFTKCDLKLSDKPDEMLTKPKLDYEDYLSPNEPLFYEISSQQLRQVKYLQISFVSVGYGDFTVCKSRNGAELTCFTSAGKEEVVLNITNPCDHDHLDECLNLLFKIEMDSSQIKCAENDCRYPDQVRFLIRLDDLQCGKSGSSLLQQNFYIVVVLVISLVKFLEY